MNNRIVGVDSLSPVTNELADEVADALGSSPLFWGRYFTSPTTAGSGEFHHRNEGPVLSARGTRVLPIARQTNRVGGSTADGLQDGADNAADLLATFGAEQLLSGGSVRIFLDVEGGGVSRLSQAYYEGWVQGLEQGSAPVSILPCVYGIPSDATTWSALARAVAAGVRCGGVWLSHPLQGVAEPVAWNANQLKPFPGIAGVPLLLWQYLFGEKFDKSQVNPELGDASDFLSTLVLPGAPPSGSDIA